MSIFRHPFPPARILPPLLLFAGAVPLSAAEHPLATVTKRLPAITTISQVTEVDGQVMMLSADPLGMVLREGSNGQFQQVATGLPGISQVHRCGAVWGGLAAGKLWRSTAWPVWEEIALPDSAVPVEIRVLNGEGWGWTWGGLRWNNGSATRIDPRLFRSADLREWTEVTVTPDPAARARSFSDLAWAAGRYVLTGDAYQQVDGVFRHAGGLWTSVDGSSWQRESAVDGTYTSVAHGGAGWLAGGTGQSYAVSGDGITWSKRTHPFISHYLTNGYSVSPVYSPLEKVIWLPSGYHALASGQMGSDYVVISQNGIDWSNGIGLESGDVSAEPKLSAVDGKAWLWGGGSVWSSDDWRWGAQRILPEEPSDWCALAASPERAVVLGDEGRAGWSADGAQWYFVPLPGNGSVPVAAVWAADRREFLAVGTGADPDSMRIWRSADGAAWGSRLAGGCRAPVGLVRGGGNYVAAMADGWIWYSPDGLTWNQAAIDVPVATPWLAQPAPLQALAYDGVTFVGVKLRGGLVVSSDGVSWTSRSGPREYDQDVRAAVCGAGGRWIHTDHWSTSLSEDLVVWHQSTGSVSPQAWVHAFGEFIAVDWRGVTSSTDGLMWTPRSDLVGLRHLTPFKSTMLMAGDNGLICQSAPWTDPVEAWQALHFTAAQLADPDLSGDDRDPDRDGLPNLLEYALGLNPWTPDARNAIRYYNSYYVGPGEITNRYLVLEFPAWEASPGVSVWAEHSPDLQTWSRTGLLGNHVWDNDGYKKFNGRLVWTRELQVTGAAGFLRLRAERADHH
jgi:hypothetical protein